MLYNSYSLNGNWEMEYAEERYMEKENPFTKFGFTNADTITDAVPNYWEDMTDEFLKTSFFGKLRINPEYGLQRYPIAGTPPDMALPNILGTFFYRRTFVCDSVPTSYSVVYFEGVQNTVSLWINDVYLGNHSGYSTPFEIEIPNGIIRSGENTIILAVSNHRLKGYDNQPVSGLTSRAVNECTGGITGDVQIRVYNSPIRDIAVMTALDLKSVNVIVESAEKVCFNWTVANGEKILKSGSCSESFDFDTQGLEFWSPENPILYTLKISGDGFEHTQSFGIRRLVADGVHFKLNDTPYFLRGICEHCYFPDTVQPNHDIAYYYKLIKTLKELGFNFIRFHTYIPPKEYMEAADQLGMLMHIESPNNTTLEEWSEIVRFCRHYTSSVIYCCGNELLMDEPFIDHIKKCADEVHKNTDALFSPMSALRGLEYMWDEPNRELLPSLEPFEHHPKRIETVGAFSDMYSSYANELLSYNSLDGTPEILDDWSRIYNKPRVSHEICIDGTYADLSLKDRYKNSRIGKTEMFSSIEEHLRQKGLLEKAPIYFNNSSQWQRRVRKYCFEVLRRSDTMAGYDFLGPIDTHWHTFGYDVGMMNEFYELKPGETTRNVLMYNSETVLLNDLGKNTNFQEGDNLDFGIYTSYYGTKHLDKATLNIRLFIGNKCFYRNTLDIENLENGKVSELCKLSIPLPKTEKPQEMHLYATLDGEELFCENQWELYLFPKTEPVETDGIILSNGMNYQQLAEAMKDGKTVVLLGATPFSALPTSFRISLAGRTAGNLATVIAEHKALGHMPHNGFCGWQFANMLENGNSVCFETESVPFDPIIEVVSTHKYAIRQSALFEFNVLNGKLLVCSLNFDSKDYGAEWFKAQLINYAKGNDFKPKHTIDEKQLYDLANCRVEKLQGNTNFAFNANDKTAVRK